MFHNAKINLVWAVALMSCVQAQATFWGYEGARDAAIGRLWEYKLKDYTLETYGVAVETLMEDFEKQTGKKMEPSTKGRVGLKVYTNSGEGLGTPLNLVRGVITALERRGYSRAQLFIIDAGENGLRANGFLPPLSQMGQGYAFEGVPVYALDRGAYYDAGWFYDNALPRQAATPLGRELLNLERSSARYDAVLPSEDRKSFLAGPLITQVDFWINLPVVTDHPAMELNGVLANATLWAVSNRERFFLSPANAPIAVAEIAAIPEWQSGWALTILSLEQYQFIGGPFYNSLYTRREPLLWLSADPVALDALMWDKLNFWRKEVGFNELSKNRLQIDYAHSLKLGEKNLNKLQWRRFPEMD